MAYHLCTIGAIIGFVGTYSANRSLIYTCALTSVIAIGLKLTEGPTDWKNAKQALLFAAGFACIVLALVVAFTNFI